MSENPMQDNEVYFTCEVCGEKFPAHPDGVLECSADFSIVNPETGQIIEASDALKSEIETALEDNPQLKPFLKGTIFVCFTCQDEWAKDMIKLPEPI